MDKSELFERQQRIANRNAKRSLESYMKEEPGLFNEDLNVSTQANRQMNRVGNKALLLRDVLWLSYDIDMKKVLSEYLEQRKERGGFQFQGDGLGSLVVDDNLAYEHVQKLTEKTIGRSWDVAVADLMDDIYFSPEVGEHLKESNRQAMEHADEEQKKLLQFVIDNVDELIESGKEVTREGKPIVSASNGWYSLRKAREKRGTKDGAAGISASRMEGIVKGLESSFMALREMGVRGHMSYGDMLDDIDPDEELLRSELSPEGYEALNDMIREMLELYVTKEEFNRFADSVEAKFRELGELSKGEEFDREAFKEECLNEMVEGLMPHIKSKFDKNKASMKAMQAALDEAKNQIKDLEKGKAAKDHPHNYATLREAGKLAREIVEKAINGLNYPGRKEVNGKIREAIEAQSERIDEVFSGIFEQIKELEEGLAETNGKVEKNSQDIARLSNDYNTLSEQMVGLGERTGQKVRSGLDEAKRYAGEVAAGVGQEAANNLNAELEPLKTRVQKNEEDIAGLTNRVSEAEAGISENASKIRRAELKGMANEAGRKENKAACARNQKGLERTQQKQAKDREDIDANTKRSQANEKTLGEQAGQIANLEQNSATKDEIESLGQEVANNAENINNNSEAILDTRGKIRELGEKVSENAEKAERAQRVGQRAHEATERNGRAIGEANTKLRILEGKQKGTDKKADQALAGTVANGKAIEEQAGEISELGKAQEDLEKRLSETEGVANGADKRSKENESGRKQTDENLEEVKKDLAASKKSFKDELDKKWNKPQEPLLTDAQADEIIKYVDKGLENVRNDMLTRDQVESMINAALKKYEKDAPFVKREEVERQISKGVREGFKKQGNNYLNEAKAKKLIKEAVKDLAKKHQHPFAGREEFNKFKEWVRQNLGIKKEQFDEAVESVSGEYESLRGMVNALGEKLAGYAPTEKLEELEQRLEGLEQSVSQGFNSIRKDISANEQRTDSKIEGVRKSVDALRKDTDAKLQGAERRAEEADSKLRNELNDRIETTAKYLEEGTKQTQESLEGLRHQVSQVEQTAEDALSAGSRANNRLDTLEPRVDELEQKEEKTEQEVAAAKKSLGDRITKVHNFVKSEGKDYKKALDEMKEYFTNLIADRVGAVNEKYDRIKQLVAEMIDKTASKDYVDAKDSATRQQFSENLDEVAAELRKAISEINPGLGREEVGVIARAVADDYRQKLRNYVDERFEGIEGRVSELEQKAVSKDDVSTATDAMTARVDAIGNQVQEQKANYEEALANMRKALEKKIGALEIGLGKEAIERLINNYCDGLKKSLDDKIGKEEFTALSKALGKKASQEYVDKAIAEAVMEVSQRLTQLVTDALEESKQYTHGKVDALNAELREVMNNGFLGTKQYTDEKVGKLYDLITKEFSSKGFVEALREYVNDRCGKIEEELGNTAKLAEEAGRFAGENFGRIRALDEKVDGLQSEVNGAKGLAEAATKAAGNAVGEVGAARSEYAKDKAAFEQALSGKVSEEKVAEMINDALPNFDDYVKTGDLEGLKNQYEARFRQLQELVGRAGVSEDRVNEIMDQYQAAMLDNLRGVADRMQEQYGELDCRVKAVEDLVKDYEQVRETAYRALHNTVENKHNIDAEKTRNNEQDRKIEANRQRISEVAGRTQDYEDLSQQVRRNLENIEEYGRALNDLAQEVAGKADINHDHDGKYVKATDMPKIAQKIVAEAAKNTMTPEMVEELVKKYVGRNEMEETGGSFYFGPQACNVGCNVGNNNGIILDNRRLQNGN